MKKYLIYVLFPVLLALFGCDGDGCKKINPKKLEGMWEIYDASSITPIGSILTFLEDGRFIARNYIKMYASVNKYSISGKHLKCMGFNNKHVGYIEGEYIMSFEGGALILNEINIGDDVFWVKLKKIDELP